MGALCLACEVEVKSETRCGDDRVDLQQGEQCDGDDFAGETCVGLGYHGGVLACTASCTLDIAPCLAEGRCGDDTVQANWSEDCDGAELDGKTCGNLGYHGGVLTCGADCKFDTSDCEAVGRCGDGIIQGDLGEFCDGENIGDVTCLIFGFYGGTLTCGMDCNFDTSGCEQGIYCGDDVIQDAWGETCDGDALDGQSCQSLGFYGGALACGDACDFDLSGCEEAGRCGDDIIQDAWGETCDGANLDGQSCQSLGFATGTLFCGADCTLDTGACFNWTQIAPGGVHTCAIGPDAGVWCWGANDYGQLGDGTTVDRHSPVAVAGLTDVRMLASGYFFTCAVRANGTVWCWGYNGEHQLGDLTYQNRSAPVQVIGLSDVATVTSGISHVCVTLTDGTVRCWGANSSGQLGDGTTVDRPSPVAVVGVTGADRVSASDYGACALLQSGAVLCWGANDYGQLGDGSTGGQSSTAVPVTGITTARSVDCGNSHACAVLAGGGISCWGRGTGGQLGDGLASDSVTPVAVVNLALPATAVSCGDAYTCAVLSDGSAVCWGHNAYGQLGSGTPEDRLIPTAVTGLLSIAALSCGANHVCASTTSAALYCWGYNSRGQLGDGTTTNASIPVPVQ